MKLFVTTYGKHWLGYLVVNGFAVEIVRRDDYNSIDLWAIHHGYTGAQERRPTEEWGTVHRKV